MKVAQLEWGPQGGWHAAGDGEPAPEPPSLVLVFGARELLLKPQVLRGLRGRFGAAPVVGCSTAGEILGTQVRDGSAVATALWLAATPVRTAFVPLGGAGESWEAGRRLGQALCAEPGLAHAFVLSSGVRVNGSALAAGLCEALEPGVGVTGGLAGDGDRFAQTAVVADGEAHAQGVVGVGFYGNRLLVGHGSLGGWDPFGPERAVTRSAGNVVYELDGKPALALYRTYLGPQAAELPASGLRFPLSLRLPGAPAGGPGLVRTLLAVDEPGEGLVFAGDVPEGAFVRLMRANFDRLVDGAAGAAAETGYALSRIEAEVAILISGVGRKLILRQRVEEEAEAVRGVLGAAVPLAGFYFYGEICPLSPGGRCELHNQTMTITALVEV